MPSGTFKGTKGYQDFQQKKKQMKALGTSNFGRRSQDSHGIPFNLSKKHKMIPERDWKEHDEYRDKERREAGVGTAERYDLPDRGAPCTLCGRKTHDVSRFVFNRGDVKKGAHAQECENCGYLGKEVDEFA